MGGGGIFGKKLYTPEEVAADKNSFVFICVFNPDAVKNISDELTSLNVPHCHIDAAIFSLHKDKIRQVIDLFEDDRSREIYTSLLGHRSRGDFWIDDCVSWDHSFVNPAFQRSSRNDVFVDCGAYVGDTVEQFIWQHNGALKKIIAFEPDSTNRIALEKRAKRLREEWNYTEDQITIYPYALYDKSSSSYMRRPFEAGTGTQVVFEADKLTEEIQTVAIDDILTEKYTFLKADIESYEYKMLLGAAKTIARWKPRLAICIYHNATDFYSLPLLVKELHSDYKLMVRHHSLAMQETLLYAW